jgi:protein-tyrosine phosphatase
LSRLPESGRLVMAQFSDADFATEGLGHKFVLRIPLAKATARKCAVDGCGCDIRAHSRMEVTDCQFLEVLNVLDDGKATVILDNELSVGSYKAALAACRTPKVAVINCAGKKLHDFLPPTRKAFDELRNERPPRLLDVEWEDTERFEIPFGDIEAALGWARVQVASGRTVLINCAQGKSRSGTMATAYLCAKMKITVGDALARIKARRPLVEPNPTFMRTLHTFEAKLQAVWQDS